MCEFLQWSRLLKPTSKKQRILSTGVSCPKGAAAYNVGYVLTTARLGSTSGSMRCVASRSLTAAVSPVGNVSSGVHAVYSTLNTMDHRRSSRRGQSKNAALHHYRRRGCRHICGRSYPQPGLNSQPDLVWQRRAQLLSGRQVTRPG